MFKKFLSMTLCTIMVLGMSTTTFAAEPQNENETQKSKIVEYMCTINSQMGLAMSPQDVKDLESSVEFSAQKYSQENGISMDAAYSVYYEELTREVPLNAISRSSGGDDIGTTQLPTSSLGDIFFVDNSMPYNHVGIYASTNAIVESMPKDGVKYWSVTNREAWQSPVNDDKLNDSCILRVTTTSTNKNNAASWANNADRLGKPYDWDFLDNKNDYYYINMGTSQFPNMVRFEESDAYNCSELVWKAFKKNGNIDLDSNGGLAVYPNNIYNSSKVTNIKTW